MMNNKLKIVIGTDHGGYELKSFLVSKIMSDSQYEIFDFGCYSKDAVDYPEYAAKVCTAIQNKTADFGILICTTGLGMSIAANRYREIRAALCHNEDMAELARLHNDANVLVLGKKYLNEETAYKILMTFLKTKFSNDIRHILRISKIEGKNELGN